MLLDEVEITIKAGHGGAGKVSYNGRGPDGGNGGKGGDIYLGVTSDLKALNQFSHQKYISGFDGQPGRNRRSYGKNGSDITLVLPLGTTLMDLNTNSLIELSSLEQKILICKGGMGGRGNLEFKSSRNRSPNSAQPGRPGDLKKFRLILRFIADFGLIGLPNAGKSSLLNELTGAKAVIGAYPFTTLEANLGAFGDKIIADIPGLIAGASSGRGLGIKFLKHIEKVRMLLHCISAESKNVLSDYHIVNRELEQYNPGLVNKKHLILLTKTDLVDQKTIQKQTRLLTPLGHSVYPVSIHDLTSIEQVKLVLI